MLGQCRRCGPPLVKDIVFAVLDSGHITIQTFPTLAQYCAIICDNGPALNQRFLLPIIFYLYYHSQVTRHDNMQSQKAVTAHFSSEQLLPFDFTGSIHWPAEQILCQPLYGGGGGGNEVVTNAHRPLSRDNNIFFIPRESGRQIKCLLKLTGLF